MPAVGTKGRIAASAARCRRTSRSNSAQPEHRSTWLRRRLRRGNRLDARRVARRACAQQRLTRLEHESLDLLPAHAEDRRDLLVGLVSELEEDEGGPLVVRQALQLRHQLAQLGAPLDLGGRALDGARARRDRFDAGVGPARAQRGQAAVAGDRVQPRAQLDGPGAAAQGPVRRHEAVLQGVLGLLAVPQHVSAEREQPTVVAVVDDLERVVVAGAHASDEPIVADAYQAPTARRMRRPDVDRGGTHRASMRHRDTEM
jgi:hypothetical protein